MLKSGRANHDRATLSVSRSVAAETGSHLNIGFFTDSYLPRRSGVVRAIESAVRGLRERGQGAYVFAPAYAGHVDTDPDIYRFPSIASPGYPDFPLGVPYSSGHLRTMRNLRL